MKNIYEFYQAYIVPYKNNANWIIQKDSNHQYDPQRPCVSP